MKTYWTATMMMLSFLAAEANQDTPLPVAAGDFCTLWYQVPRNERENQTARRTFVYIQQVRENWALVELYYSREVAIGMCLVVEIERETDIGTRYLKTASITKNQFLEKVAAEPLTAKHRRTLWINLAAVEAITPIHTELKFPE